MPEGYRHLTYEERCQIFALIQSGHSQAAIARQIGVNRSTIPSISGQKSASSPCSTSALSGEVAAGSPPGKRAR